MRRLSTEQRVSVLRCLVEGCSVNATCRMTGVSKPTVLRLLLEVGAVCSAFEDEQINSLECREIECDEVWGFCHAKDRNLPAELRGIAGFGSVWTWVCLCPRTKLIVSWVMGDRDSEHANALMRDLADRLSVRPQISTDGLGLYASAIAKAFGTAGCEYGMELKEYGHDDTSGRYSPAKCVACKREAVYGNPDMSRVTTSFVERSHLTLRMTQRRWTRLTNAHSKNFAHMEASFALHAWHNNWARKHSTTKQTPAQSAGLADRAWTLSDLVRLLAEREAAAIATGSLKRGPYKSRAVHP